MLEGDGHTLRVVSTQVLQRWKDMSDAHFVPRPLPGKQVHRRTAQDCAAAGLPVAVLDEDAAQQPQQQQQQLKRQPVPHWHGVVDATSPAMAVPDKQDVASQAATVSSPEQQLTYARPAAAHQCRRHKSSPLTEQCSDPDTDPERIDNGEAVSSGVCKFYVNSGRCPRGELCPHVHDASLRQRWLRDR